MQVHSSNSAWKTRRGIQCRPSPSYSASMVTTADQQKVDGLAWYSTRRRPRNYSASKVGISRIKFQWRKKTRKTTWTTAARPCLESTFWSNGSTGKVRIGLEQSVYHRRQHHHDYINTITTTSTPSRLHQHYHHHDYINTNTTANTITTTSTLSPSRLHQQQHHHDYINTTTTSTPTPSRPPTPSRLHQHHHDRDDASTSTPFSCACVVPVHTWLMLVLASYV